MLASKRSAPTGQLAIEDKTGRASELICFVISLKHDNVSAVEVASEDSLAEALSRPEEEPLLLLLGSPSDLDLSTFRFENPRIPVVAMRGVSPRDASDVATALQTSSAVSRVLLSLIGKLGDAREAGHLLISETYGGLHRVKEHLSVASMLMGGIRDHYWLTEEIPALFAEACAAIEETEKATREVTAPVRAAWISPYIHDR